MEKYREEYLEKLSEDFGIETDDPDFEEMAGWWDVVINAIQEKKPIPYEGACFIPEKMYEKLKSQGWDFSGVNGQAESGEVLPPR